MSAMCLLRAMKKKRWASDSVSLTPSLAGAEGMWPPYIVTWASSGCPGSEGMKKSAARMSVGGGTRGQGGVAAVEIKRDARRHRGC